MAVLDYTCIMLIHASFNISPKSTLTALSLTIPCVLDKSEVIAKPIEQFRFLPWEFDTDSKLITGYYWGGGGVVRKMFIGECYFKSI